MDPRNAAMQQSIENEYRQDVKEMLRKVLTELAEVKVQLAALQPKPKSAKD